MNFPNSFFSNEKNILYLDDMLDDDDDDDDDEEEEEEMEEESQPPETKKPKMDMVHKTFTWTEWDQKLEGDRVKVRVKVEKKNFVCMMRGTYFYLYVIYSVYECTLRAHQRIFAQLAQSQRRRRDRLRRHEEGKKEWTTDGQSTRRDGHSTPMRSTRNGQYQVYDLHVMYV